MTLRDELFQRLANQLSLDIACELRESAMSVASVVDTMVPRGTPGAQYHRPALSGHLENLLLKGTPLDLVTCLQMCEAYEWPVGLLYPEDDDFTDDDDSES